MKAIATMTAAAALLALAACDRLGIGGGPAANEAANASANATGNASKDNEGGNNAQAGAGLGDKDGAGAAQASSGSGGLDEAYITGRWTDDGDCSDAIEFFADRRYVAANGDEGLWHLEGNRLTIQGARAITIQIEPIDQNVMNVVNPDGTLGRSTRC